MRLPWLVFVVLILGAGSASAAKLHGVGNEARPHATPAMPSSPPTYPRGNRYLTPERNPSTSSGDYNVWPQYAGSDWWVLAQMLTYLPFGLPHDLLEGHGPRAFVYEGRPYAHHGKGIVRTEPLTPFEQREDDKRTGPRMDAEVFQYAPPQSENNWWPGEEVARVDDATSASEDDPIADMTPLPTEYPPLPALPDAGADWRDGGHIWAAQIQADIAFVDNDTWRIRPRIRLFTPTRWELDGEFAFYRESLSAADADVLRRNADWLGMGVSHISYRFAQSQAVQFRAGAGVRFMVTPDDSEIGVDTVYGFDAFIHNPLILSGTVSLGTVGQAFVNEERIQLGFVFQGLEMYGGYERLGVGKATLAGPMVGLRYWF